MQSSMIQSFSFPCKHKYFDAVQYKCIVFDACVSSRLVQCTVPLLYEWVGSCFVSKVARFCMSAWWLQPCPLWVGIVPLLIKSLSSDARIMQESKRRKSRLSSKPLSRVDKTYWSLIYSQCGEEVFPPIHKLEWSTLENVTLYAYGSMEYWSVPR